MQALRGTPARQAAAGRAAAPAKPALQRHVACAAGARAPADGPAEPTLLQRAALGLLAAATTVMPLTAFQAPPAEAKLTAGDPIKNASAILRYALPIDNKPIRQAQRDLEAISEELRVPGSKSLGPIQRSVRSAQSAVTGGRDKIVAAFAPGKKEAGLAALAKLEAGLVEFQGIIDAKDKQAVPIKQREVLEYLGEVEEAMVQGLNFQVPKEYADRPLLKGRATLEMKVAIRETPEGPQNPTLTVVLDGYNAPVSAGQPFDLVQCKLYDDMEIQRRRLVAATPMPSTTPLALLIHHAKQFFDLVQRKFYDDMEIQRADGFVVQTGDPDGPGPETGFKEGGKLRTVPLEIRGAGDKEPTYDLSFEDLGRYNDTPVLPFNAYGTLAWARSEFDNNSASSQVFFLLKESELTPTGANLLDGRYAVFGYVTQGQDALGLMKVGDKINYIKVVKGAENFQPGKGAGGSSSGSEPAAE